MKEKEIQKSPQKKQKKNIKNNKMKKKNKNIKNKICGVQNGLPPRGAFWKLVTTTRLKP